MALVNVSRLALRAPCMATRLAPTLQGASRLRAAPIAPMATSAHEQMKLFWEKNQKLKRPSSPWIIYRPHIPMMTSLTHRVTGIVMGVVLYGIAIGTYVAPGDFPTYVEFLKNLNVPTPVWFTVKSICAFPLVYHFINGIRHLSWDAGYGLKLATQYKTGKAIIATAIAISMLLASIAYW